MVKYTLENELSSQSEYSPKPVQNDEELLRLAYEPEQFVKGKIIPAAISTRDLLERGYSVFRRSFADDSSIHTLAINQQDGKEAIRQIAYAAVFGVKKVRECKIDIDDDGTIRKVRSFTVIDEALPDENSHATIYSFKAKSKARVKKLKFQLIEIINEYIEIKPPH